MTKLTDRQLEVIAERGQLSGWESDRSAMLKAMATELLAGRKVVRASRPPKDCACSDEELAICTACWEQETSREIALAEYDRITGGD